MDAQRSRFVTPPHAALRAATTVAHERLHQLPQFVGLTGGSLTRASYRDLLVRLLGFHAPFEDAIAAKLGDSAFGLDLARLRRAALLRADLAALGLSERDINCVVPCRFAPSPPGRGPWARCMWSRAPPWAGGSWRAGSTRCSARG